LVYTMRKAIVEPVFGQIEERGLLPGSRQVRRTLYRPSAECLCAPRQPRPRKTVHAHFEEGGHDRGVLAMGVLQDATWHHFKMDQGDPDHRAAFLNGEVPEDLTVLPASTPRN